MTQTDEILHADDRADDVLVVGSANIDLIMRVSVLPSRGETVLGGDAVLRPGGKGANQAVAAALAGARVAIAGCVGEDAHARILRQALERADVDVSLLRSSPQRSTGFAVVLIDSAGENAIAVSPGANHALTPEDVEQLRPRLRRSRLLLMQMELPLPVVIRAVEIAAECRTPVVLNLAPATALPSSILAQLSVLVVNHSEAEHLVGTQLPNDAALLTAVRALRSLGPAAVVVTAGGAGAAFGDGTGAGHQPAVPVEVVDTAGAGDAFAGVLAARLSQGRSLAEAVRDATQAGAAAVGRHGAQLTRPITLSADEVSTPA